MDISDKSYDCEYMNWPSTEKKDIENQITDVEGTLNYIYTILVLSEYIWLTLRETFVKVFSSFPNEIPYIYMVQPPPAHMYVNKQW